MYPDGYVAFAVECFSGLAQCDTMMVKGNSLNLKEPQSLDV